jgi:hypothetical protein
MIVSKVTVGQLAIQFLTSKKARVESGELSKRTFDDYHVTCETAKLLKAVIVSEITVGKWREIHFVHRIAHAMLRWPAQQHNPARFVGCRARELHFRGNRHPWGVA